MVNYERMSREELAIFFANLAYIPLLDKTAQPFSISTKIIKKKATVWSVNYGLSGNLWIPPETGHGGFRHFSRFFH